MDTKGNGIDYLQDTAPLLDPRSKSLSMSMVETHVGLMRRINRHNRKDNLSAKEILDWILKLTDDWTLPRLRIWKFLILGKGGPTGKTWLCEQLRREHIIATELSEDIYDLIEYKDNNNHVITCACARIILIVLNKPLDKELLKRGKS